MKEGSIVHMKCIKAAENNCFLNKERNKLAAQPVCFPSCNRFKIAPTFNLANHLLQIDLCIGKLIDMCGLVLESNEKRMRSR